MMDLHEILGASTPSGVCILCPSPRAIGLQVCQSCWDAHQPGGRLTAQAAVDPVVDRVCGMLLERSRLGVAKYGTTLADSPAGLRIWLMHTLEETLDKANYLMRAIMEIDKE